MKTSKWECFLRGCYFNRDDPRVWVYRHERYKAIGVTFNFAKTASWVWLVGLIGFGVGFFFVFRWGARQMCGDCAAYELLDKSNEMDVTVLEESHEMGGISKTVNYKGNRMDMGGHRFFTKVPEVNEWWDKMLPKQGAPSKDDIMLDRTISLEENGPDPEKEDRVMLTRNRVSRIFFNQKFFDYPISMKFETIKNMGFGTTIVAGFSYVWYALFKKKENSLEDFYINRFGKKLYSMFFEHYTANLWGRHPSEIDPSWGAQRVKGLSITAILKDMFGKILPGKKNRKVETSLIESFMYPKLGPGELWDVTATEIEKKGGKIMKGCKVVGFERDDKGQLTKVIYETEDGEKIAVEADIVISSMPVKDLVAGLPNVPEEKAKIAAGLPYRDYMTLGVLCKKLKLVNKTKLKTVGNIVPDNWVYVHDRSVTMGRFQIYNNWSPYMVKDLDNTVFVGLEYFANEGDELWNMEENEFIEFAKEELEKMFLRT